MIILKKIIKIIFDFFSHIIVNLVSASRSSFYSRIFVGFFYVISVLIIVLPHFISFFIFPSMSSIFQIVILITFHFVIAGIFKLFVKQFSPCEANLFFLNFKDLNNWYFLCMQYSISVIYLLFWGLYFAIIRFFRIGETIFIYNIINRLLHLYLDIVLFIVFPSNLIMIILWILFLRLPLISIRNELWDFTAHFLYALHLRLLQFVFYNNVFYFLHKAAHLSKQFLLAQAAFISYDSKDSPRIPKKPWWLINFLFLAERPYLLKIIYFSPAIIEIIFNMQLYYTFYLLFFYPFISTLFYLLFYPASPAVTFVDDCARSDYLARRFDSPKFGHAFWYNFPQGFFDYYRDFIPYIPIHKDQDQLLIQYKQKIDFHHNVFLKFDDINFTFALKARLWGLKCNPKTIFNPNSNVKPDYNAPEFIDHPAYKLRHWRMRFSYHYRAYNYRARWFHSSRQLCSPIKGEVMPAVLLNLIKHEPAPGTHFLAYAIFGKPNLHVLQRSFCLLPQTQISLFEDLYSNTKVKFDPHSSNKLTLNKLFENNFILNFQLLVEKGVVVGTYPALKPLFNHNTYQSMQSRPDVSLNFANSSYLNKSYLGIDHKCGLPNNVQTAACGRNQVLSCSQEDFANISRIFRFNLERSQQRLLTKEQEFTLKSLRNNAFSDFNAQLDAWGNGEDHFPPRWAPPLYIENPINTNGIKPEILDKMKAAYARQTELSELALKRGATKWNNSDLSDSALDKFGDSFLKDLL